MRMREITATIISLLLIGCSPPSKGSTSIVSDTIFVEKVKTDTVFVENTEKVNALQNRLKRVEDSIKFYRDSASYKNYINGRKVEKIKYYIKICEKNTKNKKYFFGWIKRTMTEK